MYNSPTLFTEGPSPVTMIRGAAATAQITVQKLRNTHWHFDHTDGNEWLHSSGARIIAHENTRKHLSTTTRVEGWNFTFPPSPAEALPTEVFKENLALQLNGVPLALQ
jgi:glyoxylase-like metal-dependent hydrolase (beta-lactamase superfamily II)